MTVPSAKNPTHTHTPSTKQSRKAKPAQSPRRHARLKPKPAPTGWTKAGPQALRPRAGSKTAKMLALLKRPQGASLKELMKATGWQPHSIRGFLSGIVTRRMCLKVKSIKPESGERRYAVKA